MHCARCGSEGPIPVDVCPSCGETPLLGGQYRLDEVLGRGAQGVTWAATRVADGARVVAKELPLRAVDDWSVVERFRREAAILKQLDHPDIPRLLDELESGEGRARAVWLVQARVEGRSLEAELATRRYSEDEVLEVGERVARILAYLHERRPPVIHRDVKPSNLVRRAEDGGLSLVDFGAVRDTLPDPALGGRTVVGTFGYMAPEQLKGDAFPASDVYGLGATLLRLLTREDPARLVGYDGRLDPKAVRGLGPRTTALLTRMMAPDPADRPQDGAALLGAFAEPAPRSPEPPAPIERSAPVRIEPERPGRALARPEHRALAPRAPRAVGQAVSRAAWMERELGTEVARGLAQVAKETRAARRRRRGRRYLPHRRRPRRSPASVLSTLGIIFVIAGFALGLGVKLGFVGIVLLVVGASERRRLRRLGAGVD